MIKRVAVIGLAIAALAVVLYNLFSIKIITTFRVASISDYPPPCAGDVYYENALLDAREYYKDKNVKYLVALDVSDKNGEKLSDIKVKAECERLISCGYKLYSAKQWNYMGNNEKENYISVGILLSEEEFENFNFNKEYGYYLAL